VIIVNFKIEHVPLLGAKLFQKYPPGVVTAKLKDAILSGMLVANSVKH